MNQEQLNQKTSPRELNDELLENVTGGSGFQKYSQDATCPYCTSTNVTKQQNGSYVCNACQQSFVVEY